MVKQINVSVIIPTYNEELNLPRLLKSLKEQTFCNFEIIIVDNYSTDSTKKIAEQYKAKFYLFGNERSAQRNFGVKKARGKYLLFLDADMELPPDIISECVERIDKQKLVGIVIPENIPISNFFSRIKQLEKRIYWNEPNIEAARFFKKSSLLKVGGYNEALIAGEDWDLSQRIMIKGKIGRIPTQLHHHETFLLRELRHKIYYAKQINQYVKLHPELFRQQSGINRFKIFWSKKNLLFSDPLATIGLFFLKTIEYMIYLVYR